jgi:hypothetical protein
MTMEHAIPFMEANSVITPVLAWLLLGLCCGFAATAGGRNGRVGAALLVGATLGSWSFRGIDGQADPVAGIVIIDFLLLAGLFALVLKSRVFWPIWVAGFHLLTVEGHVVAMILPEFRGGIFWRFAGIWPILMVAAMTMGIALDVSKGVKPSENS